MTYEDKEHSIREGQPYFLYAFSNNTGTTRLVSFPTNVTVGGFTWTASPVAHDEVEQAGSVERAELQLDFPLSDTFARDFLEPTTQVTTLTVYRAHFSDPSGEVQSYWKGRLIGATTEDFKVVVKAESVFTSLRRPGCRVRVQRSCRHDHYGPVGCTLNRATWEVNGQITAVSGLNLTIPAAAGFTAGRFTAGIVNWGGKFGYIQEHSGSSIVLISEIPDLDDATLPQAVKIAPGCDRSLDGSVRGCMTFNNQLNFGGFRWLPSQNPFSGSII